MAACVTTAGTYIHVDGQDFLELKQGAFTCAGNAFSIY